MSDRVGRWVDLLKEMSIETSSERLSHIQQTLQQNPSYYESPQALNSVVQGLNQDLGWERDYEKAKREFLAPGMKAMPAETPVCSLPVQKL